MPTELALRLCRLGDYRSKATIMRSIQRMSAGDAAVSGEMLVIAKMLVNQQRLLEYKQAQVDWKKQHDDWAATIDGFKVRWNLVHRFHFLFLAHDNAQFYAPYNEKVAVTRNIVRLVVRMFASRFWPYTSVGH